MNEEELKTKSLDYHREFPAGKTSLLSTKPTRDSVDLSLAYSPGVAFPCLEISENDDKSYEFTNKGNLVGVISNGTAVLGLGDLGAQASKPVMEGKAVLFKKFAGIDVFDIELKSKDSGDLIRAVKMMEPTFGGINLEDIKAPECFHIEDELIKIMNIPVFHDDQHGTAVITIAAVINALFLSGKKASDVKVVICGAGAAAIAIGRLIQFIGVRKENIFMTDTKGVIHTGRLDLTGTKKEFARDTDARTLGDIMKDADFFIGVSVKDQVEKDMIASMAKNPCVLAMANPDPEIPYEVAKSVRKDLIMGTGRSDFPNQVNNVLGFPYIFRGALDTRSKSITLEMKLACAYALSELARKEVPDSVTRAYGGVKFSFGPEYIIPKPFDERVFFEVSTAVAIAATKFGVARIAFPGEEKYKENLKKRISG
ncbi:MAG: malic enzyme-like NAD(P)-binding protein [Leptospiraceae bacterium]|nr:malic enzyme-like NAD(P)-binding protein [Leptospiraceae bacterium]